MALPARQQAIDVMRGLTLALMMVVNMSISETQSYAPLVHALWHGLTLTDLVFPSFLLVVGAAMSFTLDRYQAQGTAVFLAKVGRRTLLIFLCGYLLYWFPFFTHDSAGHLVFKPWSETRIPGVLQRIALTYGFAACGLFWWGLAMTPWQATRFSSSTAGCWVRRTCTKVKVLPLTPKAF